MLLSAQQINATLGTPKYHARTQMESVLHSQFIWKAAAQKTQAAAQTEPIKNSFYVLIQSISLPLE